MMLFWVGVSLLVLVGVYLDCSKAPETTASNPEPTQTSTTVTPNPTETPITITGRGPGPRSYSASPDPDPVMRANHDSVAWLNKTDDNKAVVVCMYEDATAMRMPPPLTTHSRARASRFLQMGPKCPQVRYN